MNEDQRGVIISLILNIVGIVTVKAVHCRSSRIVYFLQTLGTDLSHEICQISKNKLFIGQNRFNPQWPIFGNSEA